MNSSMSKALLRSLIISYVLSGLMILLLSLALYKLKLKEGQINTAIFAVYGIVCLVGGFVSGKSAGSRRFFWGLLTGLLYFLVLFAVSTAFSKGSIPDLSRSMTVLAFCTAGGMLGGMLS